MGRIDRRHTATMGFAMNHSPRSARWLTAAISLIVIATFAIDLATPRGVAAGVFPHFLAIFLAAWLPWPRAPYAVAAVASLLSVLGYLLTSGGNPEIILLNRLLTFAALWLSAVLAHLRIRADQSLRKDRGQFQARVESILDQNLGHLRHAQRLARLSYWIWDPEKQKVTDSTLGSKLDDALPEVKANLSDREFVARYVHPEDRERVLAAYEVDTDEISALDIEYRLVLPGGEQRDVHEIGEPVLSPDGRPIAQFGTIQDITQQKRTHQALRDGEARFRDFAETASDYFWEMGPDLRFTFTQAQRSSADVDPARLLGKTRWELAGVDPEQDPKWRGHYAQLKAHEPFRNFVFQFDDPSRKMHIRVNGNPVFDAQGEFAGYRGTASDISAEVEAEAALRASEASLRDLQGRLLQVSRTSAMGELSSALAHELHQPLTAILNSAQAGRRVLESKTGRGVERMPEMLELIGQQAERAGPVVRSLRRVFERGELGLAPVDTNEVVTEASALALIGAREHGIRVTQDLASDLPPVMIDRVQIEQVTFNLLRNAIEAMSESAERDLTVTTALNAAGEVEIAVGDSGPGLPAEVREQLFQPFVTTKAGGTGIGLSTSRTIVQAHGGKIWV